MRYPRLRDLIELVRMMQASASGISIRDIESRFEVSRRTAERMRDAVLDTFIQVEELRLDDGTKRWRLKDRVLMPATGIGTDDLAALETIGKVLKGERHGDLRASLRRTGDALRATMQWRDLARAEPDIEVIAEAEGIASRPGPQETVKPDVIVALREAIKCSAVIRLTHWTAGAKRPSRGHEVEPLGLLYATGRRYLVGRSRHHGEIHLFRLGRVESVQITDESFQRPRGFNIEEYARKSFGVFQEKPVEVVWRFSPEAAAEARTFLFHPTQKLRSLRDGSLLVTFKAGGLLEMCRHLFTWGDAVEILRPQKLRIMYRQLLADAARTTKGR
jgi:predicted DNA-binding transcriptional regulator YafY